MSVNRKGRVFCDFCGKLASSEGSGDYYVDGKRLIYLHAVLDGNGQQTKRDICERCSEKHPEVAC